MSLSADRASSRRPAWPSAEAKIVDAETVEDAVEWLHNKERMVVLHDRALLDMLVNLKPKPVEAQAAE